VYLDSPPTNVGIMAIVTLIALDLAEADQAQFHRFTITIILERLINLTSRLYTRQILETLECSPELREQLLGHLEPWILRTSATIDQL
jgi:hypothetical protein